MFGKVFGFAAFGMLLASEATATDIDINKAHEQASFESLVKRQAGALPPSQDPFYAVPANISAYKNGAIIDHRPTNISGTNYTAAYQILYKTTDSVGEDTATVTTVIIPTTPNYEQLLSFQIPYDSPDVDCSPSYTLATGGFSLTGGLQDVLNKGWIVSTPDYEGPKAAFTAGVISGQATLDSVRAALASECFTGICPVAKVAMWGYSGGALASEWAAELQKKYAPELTFVGAALGGTTPDVLNVAIAVNNHTLAGLIPAGITGLAAAYQNLSAYIEDRLIPEKKAGFNNVKQFCIAQEVLAYHDQDFFAYFKGGEADLYAPVAQDAINNGGRMGLHGRPEFNLFVYKSVFDEVSPVNDTDALVKKYCDAGTPIKYLRFNFGNHLEASTDGEPYALDYLTEVFNGVPQATACNITTVQPSASPAARL